jgi:hypothetical protein
MRLFLRFGCALTIVTLSAAATAQQRVSPAPVDAAARVQVPRANTRLPMVSPSPGRPKDAGTARETVALSPGPRAMRLAPAASSDDGKSRARSERMPPLTEQAHADQALALAKRFPRIGFHYSAADAAKLPPDAREVVDTLLSFGSGVMDRAGRLGLEGGFRHNAPMLSPSETLAALAAIEAKSGKSVAAILAHAAAKRGVTEGGRDMLHSLSALLEGGLQKQPGFKSARILETAEVPESRGPTLEEQQAALAKAEAREAAERTEQAARSKGIDWNWVRGNHPSQSPTPLFVRK